MKVLDIGVRFCEPFSPNPSFLDKVLDILCDYAGVTGIFKNGTQNDLKDIYEKMRKDINMPQYVIYPLPSSCLNPNINTKKLSKNGIISAGHDLPVWLNDPDKASCRIMVLSQDPRRSDAESLKNTIGISSPFGLHSRIWRSNLTKGFVHYAMLELINENKEKGIETSVYYTDIYKLRKVEPAKTDITNYSISYNDILCKEICLFKPTIIVTLGDDAKKSLNKINCPCLKKLNPKIVNLPHPNARYKEGKWGDLELEDDKAETKIAKIKELIKEKM